jgi:hypothetical protein
MDMDDLKAPYHFTYVAYPSSNRKFDLANVLSVVQKFTDDALIELGIIPDDCYKVIPEITYKFGGVDKVNPRAELVIKEGGWKMTKEELTIENARLARLVVKLKKENAELRAEIRKMNHPPWGIREVGEEGWKSWMTVLIAKHRCGMWIVQQKMDSISILAKGNIISGRFLICRTLRKT